MNSPLRNISSPILVLPEINIDTDQIIPARYLTTTGKTGLGKHAFADYRCERDGTPTPDCPLNDRRSSDCHVLVAGDNFGCGSSREHAPWALLDMGFRAVISTRFADIFRNNAHKNGLLALAIDAAAHTILLDSPWQTVSIDLESQTLKMPDASEVVFQIDAFAHHCLLNGIDELDFLLTHLDAIEAYERRSLRT